MVQNLLDSKRIVLILGAGGVGKTTSSIALAFVAAMEGKTVALLSIDPARRLAAALGIPLGYQLQEIQGPQGALRGKVFAGMLDQKAVFDRMVTKHAPNPEVAQKILNHPIYQAASSHISGPIEYMALAKLQELAENPIYDLIIVDTPPDTHALDFLARPNVLSGFMDQGVLSWLIKPFLLASRFGLSRFLSTSEKLMGGLAKVTGLQALTSFAEFLVLTQDIIGGFHRTGEKIVSLLHQPDTGFVLVIVPTGAASRSARNINRELQPLGYRIDLVVINRVMPEGLVQSLEELNKRDQDSGDSASRENHTWYPWWRRAFVQEQIIERTLGALPDQVECLRVDEQERELGDFQATYQLALEFKKKLNTDQSEPKT
jgi:anion-transporting  ArsA/GET3 family ATPase